MLKIKKEFLWHRWAIVFMLLYLFVVETIQQEDLWRAREDIQKSKNRIDSNRSKIELDINAIQGHSADTGQRLDVLINRVLRTEKNLQ